MKKTAACALFVLLAGAGSAQAVAAADAYGYTKYFSYHPPKERNLARTFYPYAGPVIASGQDIPVCAAARAAAAYKADADRDMRYITHGRDGWLFRTPDFRTDFKASPAALSYFSRLNGALAGKGQTLVVAFQPPRAMVEFGHVDLADMPVNYSPQKAHAGYQEFLRQLEDAGIAAVDLSEPPQGKDYFPRGDYHWSPDGAMWSAERVAKQVKKITSYDDLPRQEFEIAVPDVQTPSRGALDAFVQKTCGINIEMTAAPVWTAVAKGGAHPAQAPGIALLGTSNSAEDGKYAFAGTLKKLLSTDINNAAVAGGGFGTSPVAYFASDEYHAHPPKIVVWEFLPQHNYNNPAALAAFRQMLPAVRGACPDKAALARWSGEIKGGETDIFGDMKKVSLKDSYLYLETDAAASGSLKTEILYKDGAADEVDLARAPGGSRKYYLELGDATAAPALFFHVLTDKPGGHLTARLCRAPVNIAEK